MNLQKSALPHQVLIDLQQILGPDRPDGAEEGNHGEECHFVAPAEGFGFR
jgi:hypothetical protein